MRSPAETTIEFLLVASRFFTWVARYAAPPALTVPTRPPLPVGGRRFPWKSLRARTWTSTSDLSMISGGLGWDACAGAAPSATASRVAAPAAMNRGRCVIFGQYCRVPPG